MTTTEPTKRPDEIGDWPLWKVALRELRALPNFGFGLQLETEWFEQRFSATRDSNSFAFAMLDLRQALESEDGYYLQCQTIQQDETAMRMEVWQIPSAVDHQREVACTFKRKMRGYAQRESHILAKTLANPKAALSEVDRTRAEAQLRIAATRLVLLRREKSLHALVEKVSPKMIAA